MPAREREIHFPVTPAEERNLIAWARSHERAVSAQVRWYLRDILSGAAVAAPNDAEVKSVEVTAA